MKWSEIEGYDINPEQVYITCNDVGGVYTVKGCVIIKQNMCNEERVKAGLCGLNYTHIMPLPSPPQK